MRSSSASFDPRLTIARCGAAAQSAPDAPPGATERTPAQQGSDNRGALSDPRFAARLSRARILLQLLPSRITWPRSLDRGEWLWAVFAAVRSRDRIPRSLKRVTRPRRTRRPRATSLGTRSVRVQNAVEL